MRVSLWVLVALGAAVSRLALASPPTAPGTLTATAVSSTQVSLSWVASSDDASITAYIVQRCQGSGCTSFTQVGSIPGGTAFMDSGLAAGTTYQYQIYATDSLGATSAASNAAPATTLAASVASAVNYAYDALGRLVQAAVPALNLVESYTYDAGGNLLSMTSSPISTLAVASISTSQGGPGSTVTIYGSGFSSTPSADIVMFGNVQATVISATSTQLVVSVPAGAVSGPITVTEGSNSVTSSASFTVSATPAAPTITTVPQIATPNSLFVITGTGFQPTAAQNQAFFNTTPLTVIAATPTALTVVAPGLNSSGSVGARAGLITVTTPFGTVTSASAVVVVSPSTSFAAIGTMTVGGPPVTMNAGSIGTYSAELFQGTAGQSLAISLSGVTNATVFAFAPDGSWVSLGQSTFSANAGVSIPRLTQTGTYVIGLKSNSPGQTVSMSIVSAATATLTLNGAPVNVTTTQGQYAALPFVGTANTFISLRLSNVTLTNATVQILNPDGSLLASSALGTAGATFFPELRQAGTYTVLVTPSSTGSGSFTATLTAVTPTLVANQGAYNITFTNSTPVTVTFGGTAGDFPSLSGWGPFTNVSVLVLKPDGTQLTSTTWSWCSSCVTPVLALGPLPVSGTYSVVLTPNGSGAASLFLTTPVSIGALSPNTTSTSARSALVGQGAWATFTGLPGDYLALVVTESSSAQGFPQPVIATILAPDGTMVATFSSPIANPLNLGPVAQGGTYTIVVQPTQVDQNNTVSLEVVPAAVVNLPVGPNSPAVSLAYAQNLVGTFSGTAGQYGELYFHEVPLPTLDAGIASGTLLILAPDGTVIASASFAPSYDVPPVGGLGEGGFAGSTAMVFGPLAATGTYSVVFQRTSGYPIGRGDVYAIITLGGSGTTPLNTTTTQAAAGTSFSATAGTYVSIATPFTPPTGFPTVTVELLDPSGNVIAGPLPSTGVLSVGPLPTSGTYTVVMQNVATQNTFTPVSTALTVSTPVTGTLTPGTATAVTTTLPGQAVQFTFSGVAGHTYTTGVSAQPKAGTSDYPQGPISIVSSTGAVVASGTLTSQCSGSNCVDSSLTFGPLLATDTYTLIVQPKSPTISGESWSLQLTDNGAGTGATQSIATSTAGAAAQFTFYGSAGASYTLTFTNMAFTPSSVSQYTLQITDPSGVSFPSFTCYSANCTVPPKKMTLSGTYTVAVTPNGSATMTGTATISTAALFGPLTVGGAAVNLSLAPGQTATAQFIATAGQNLAVDLSNLAATPANSYYNIQVMDPTGTIVGSAATQSGTTLNLPNLSAATYTVSIAPGANAYASASMQITLVAGVSGTLPLTGNGVNVTTSVPGDAAYLTLPPFAGQGFSLALTNMSLTPSSVSSVYVRVPTSFVSNGLPTCNVPGCAFHFASALKYPGDTISLVPSSQATMNLTATWSPDVTATLSPGVPFNLSLGETGQSAMLTFNVTRESNPTLSVSNFAPNPSSAQYNVTVYALDSLSTSFGGTTLWSGASTATLNLPLLQPGTYVAVITPAVPAVASMRVTFQPESDTVIPSTGASTSVATSVPGQYGYIFFNGTAGQTISLALTNVVLTPASPSTFWLVVTEPSGAQIQGATPACTYAGACELALPNLPQTGTYRVTIEPPNSSTTMSFTAAILTSVPGTLASGTPTTVQWTTPGQIASLGFSLSAPQPVALNLGSIAVSPANTNITLTLYNSSGTQVASTSSSTGATLNVQTLPAGTYQVVVAPAVPVTGSLQVALWPGVGGTQPTDGTSTSIKTLTPGQYAYVSFAGIAGENLTVALTNVASVPNTSSSLSFNVFTASGSYVTGVACQTTASGCEIHLRGLPTTGNYTLIAQPPGYQTISFTATLSIDVSGTMTSGSPLSVSLGTLGESATLTFTITASENLALTISSISLTPSTGLNVVVFNSYNGQVGSVSNSTGTTLNIPGLPAGTYSVVVTPAVPATGGFQISYH